MKPVEFSFIWNNTKLFLLIPAVMILFHIIEPFYPETILVTSIVYLGLLLFRVVGLVIQHQKSSPLIGVMIMAGYTLTASSHYFDSLSILTPVYTSLMTAGLTILHAKSEAYREIFGIHWKRLIYRTAYFLTVCYIGSNSISELLLLFVNQALLFGAIFDSARNKEVGIAFFYHGEQAWYDRAINFIGSNIKILKDKINMKKAFPRIMLVGEIAGYLLTLYLLIF